MTRYRIADDVAWVSQADLDAGAEPTAYLTRVPRGMPLMLEGPGCMVWLAVSDGGTMDDIVATVADMADLGVEEVREDVETLIDQLVIFGVVAEE